MDLIGKTAASPEVERALQEFGAKPPKLKKGDVQANVTVPNAGLEFAFVDEAFFYKRKDLAIGEGDLILTTVMFYADDPGKWTGYAKPLPFDLSFSQTIPAVIEHLGPPEVTIERMGIRRWRKQDRWLFVVSKADKHSIRRIAVQIPDQS